VTARLANDIAELIPEAANLTPADLAEPAQPEPKPMAVDFAGAAAPILAALNEDALKDALTVYYSAWSKSLRFTWRGQSIDGVVAVRATDDGILVTTASGAKLVRPVSGATAEVVDVAVATEAEFHQANTASYFGAIAGPGMTGDRPSPTHSLGKAVRDYFGR
jgi:hypothetical protein